jgi:uncharacterized protein YndB with AHSA1/START domain
LVVAQDSIEREVVIEAPVERVWELITRAEHLGTWFGDSGAEIDLRPGGAVSLSWKEHGTAHGRVERVEPMSLVSYRWLTAMDREDEPTPENSTLIEFTLAEDGGSTRLRVVESGFDGLAIGDEEKRRKVEGNTEGWQIETAELAEYARRVAA